MQHPPPTECIIMYLCLYFVVMIIIKFDNNKQHPPPPTECIIKYLCIISIDYTYTIIIVHMCIGSYMHHLIRCTVYVHVV